MTKIEQLKAAYEAATGPDWDMDELGQIWGRDEEGHSYLVCNLTGDLDYEMNEQDIKNGAFILMAHRMVPELLEAAELLAEADTYLREIRAENLDGSEPELERLLLRTRDHWHRLPEGSVAG